MSGFPRGVLFDLDGTLVDSAEDFVAAIAVMAAKRGIPPVALDVIRPHVSKGSRAMLAASFPLVDAEERESWIPEFLDTYEALLGNHAPAYPHIEALLDSLDAQGVRWGIVTNKPEYLARHVLAKLNWTARCGVLIGGDTLATRKPDPLPLTVAAERLGLQPSEIVYVGDDLRDIQAANAAQMRSIAVLWGYRLEHENPNDWNASVILDREEQLLDAESWPS